MTVTPAAQRPTETVRRLPRDSGPLALYAGALRHLTGRAAVSLAAVSLRLASWATRDARETARNRADGVHPGDALEDGIREASRARHPSSAPRLTVVIDPPRPGEEDAVRETRRRFH